MMTIGNPFAYVEEYFRYLCRLFFEFFVPLRNLRQDPMKSIRILTMAAVAAGVFLSSCSSAPDIDDLKENSIPYVEQLLTEDDNDTVSHRLDRYILDGHPDKLTYTGTVKVTEFSRKTMEDGTVQVDSTKYPPERPVRFRGQGFGDVLHDGYGRNALEKSRPQGLGRPFPGGGHGPLFMDGSPSHDLGR